MTGASNSAVRSSSRSVMVVDDEPELASYLAQAFEDHYWRVTTAYDGIDALEKLIKTGVPDLLVLDLALPRMSGIELAQRIRSRYPALRIIVSTGYNVRLDTSEMQSLNIRRVLAKPYGLDTLIEAAEKTLSQGNS